MLVFLYNMHLFYATRYKLVHLRTQQAAAIQGSFLYTNRARGEGERGSSKGERENSKQGD